MTDGASQTPLLQVRGISKSFPGVKAVSGVDLTVNSGEIVGIVGENGAGKSTLMKIIAGVYPEGSFEGDLIVNGESQRFHDIKEAEAAGIVLIPQELYVAPNLSIAENMFMGHLPGNRGVVDLHQLHEQAEHWLGFFDLRVQPESPASALATSEQRLVTIAAALSKSVRLLILDEPTAALTDSEAQRLFEHIRRLSDSGVGCLYISHRLDEIEQVADRVVVMRDGEIVRQFEKASGHRDEIVREMIGRDPQTALKNRRSQEIGEPILHVSDLRVYDPMEPAKLRVNGVSFTLYRGEILGLFGLVGAGRTELAEAIFGSWRGRVEGVVRAVELNERPRSPREAIRNGIAMLTENRKLTGVIEGRTVNANVSAASIDAVANGRLVIDESREHDRNTNLILRLDVRPPRLEVNVETFSGGNQQKVLLARWLATDPQVLILDEPTYGVDVGARFELFELIRELADDGRGILMISSDLEEVVAECDRILVMYKGRLAGEYRGDVQRHELMAAATGGNEPRAENGITSS